MKKKVLAIVIAACIAGGLYLILGYHSSGSTGIYENGQYINHIFGGSALTFIGIFILLTQTVWSNKKAVA